MRRRDRAPHERRAAARRDPDHDVADIDVRHGARTRLAIVLRPLDRPAQCRIAARDARLEQLRIDAERRWELRRVEHREAAARSGADEHDAPAVLDRLDHQRRRLRDLRGRDRGCVDRAALGLDEQPR